MTPSFPSPEQVASSLRSIVDQSTPLCEDDLRRLALVLHASYGRDGADDYGVLAERYSETTDDGSDLQQDVVAAFSRLSNGDADWIVRDLVDYFGSDGQFYELGHAMLALSFPLSLTAVDGLTADNLMQREVLSAMIQNDTIWRYDMTLSDQLTERGLPACREGLAKLIAQQGNAE